MKLALVSLTLLSFGLFPCKSQLRPYSFADDTRVNGLLSSQERLAGVRRLAPGTELVREEPGGSGMVIALDRGSAGAEFGEWEVPNIREYETQGRGLASKRPSNSRRFKPSRPLQNRSPVLLRRPAAGQGQQVQGQENWSSGSQNQAGQENWGSRGQVSLENWGGQQVQSEENWLQDGGWLDQEQQQQEEGGEFYKESKWKEQQAEKRFYREPLTQQLGGQRNPRSSFF